jgi:hypothetical protein
MSYYHTLEEERLEPECDQDYQLNKEYERYCFNRTQSLLNLGSEIKRGEYNRTNSDDIHTTYLCHEISIMPSLIDEEKAELIRYIKDNT